MSELDLATHTHCQDKIRTKSNDSKIKPFQEFSLSGDNYAMYAVLILDLLYRKIYVNLFLIAFIRCIILALDRLVEATYC